MRVGPRALACMHHFESCRLEAYRCPAGVPTIGWGLTYYPDGRRVRMGDWVTQAQADSFFEQIVNRDFAPGVQTALAGAATNPAQFGAMVSLAYNIGLPKFGKSTLLRQHRAGDHALAVRQFAAWNKSNGEVLPGLTRRRAAEALLYAGRLEEFDRAIGFKGDGE